MVSTNSHDLFLTQIRNLNVRCLTEARAFKKPNTVSLLRFRLHPELPMWAIACPKGHCALHRASGCCMPVDQCMDILDFPLLFLLCNPHGTVAAKPAIPIRTNGTSLVFRISFDP